MIRRRRSERAKKPDYAPEVAEPRRQRFPVSPSAHPSSVEFLAAYNAYFDDWVERYDGTPLAAPLWRARTIQEDLA